MTDSEILRSAGLIPYLYGTNRTEVLKAMAQARADERVQVASDINIATITGDLPDICECVADFVVRGKND